VQQLNRARMVARVLTLLADISAYAHPDLQENTATKVLQNTAHSPIVR